MSELQFLRYSGNYDLLIVKDNKIYLHRWFRKNKLIGYRKVKKG